MTNIRYVFEVSWVFFQVWSSVFSVMLVCRVFAAIVLSSSASLPARLLAHLSSWEEMSLLRMNQRQRNFIVGRWNKIGVNKMVFIHGAFKRELFNAVSLKNLFWSSVAYWKCLKSVTYLPNSGGAQLKKSHCTYDTNLWVELSFCQTRSG